MKNPSVTDFLQEIGTIADALQNGEGCIVCALDVMRDCAIRFVSETALYRKTNGLPIVFDCNVQSNGNLPFNES
jgi:hypothetical protein